MAQNNIDFSGNPTGAGLMDDYLDKELQNILTSNSGIQRPSYAVAGTKWIDVSVTPWLLKIYDGTDDTIVGTINPLTHKFISNNPLTTTGDLIVQGADGNPTNLSTGALDNVLTSNGVGQIPSYKVNPVGIKSYLSTYTYKKDDVVVAVVEDKTTLYKSLIDGNKGNALTDKNSWENVSLGSGLEIGDIGFSPWGIDETKNTRRYLNGQVISQTQFAEFTTILKSWQSTRANLFTTETNWQAEKTASKLGQCGKFVVDDDAGTIRLPCVVNINGLTDLANCGMIKDESLPNITGTSGSGSNVYNNNDRTPPSGAFAKGTSFGMVAAGNGVSLYNTSFNASRSSSTYQNNAPVQQEAIRYPYFIQVATNSEYNVDITNEIQLNNPFSLFESKYSTDTIVNASWLISNGTFYSGATYVTAYQALAVENNADISAGTTVTLPNGSSYTKRGLSVKLSTDTYDDYDYVLNTTDSTFRLPIKVKPASDELKLYFYIGETIQNANLINASSVLTRVADLSDSYISSLGMPSNKYIDLTLNASGGTYTAPANGWVLFERGAKSGTKFISLTDTTSHIGCIGISVSGVTNAKIFIPVKNNDRFNVNYNADTDLPIFRFIYAEGEI